MSTDFASPFAHLLGTSFVLNTPQAAQLKSLVTDYSERIVSVKEELRKLQAKIVELETLRDGHQALLSNAIGSRPTSRDLPSDVLVHIFTHCLSTDPLPLPSVSEAPLLLTRICRSWREIALSNPRLWNTIRIVPPLIPNTRMYNETKKSYEDLIVRGMAGIRGWLDKSGCLPLSFSVRYGRRYSTPNAQETWMLWRYMFLLFDYRSRWGKVTQDLLPRAGPWDRTFGISDLPPLPPGLDFPLLKEFEFQPHTHDGSPTRRQEWERALLQSPSLRKLVINSGSFNRTDLVGLPARWKNIVHLDIRCARDDHGALPYHQSILHSTMLDLLSRCSSIQIFSAAVLCPRNTLQAGQEPGSRAPIQLARLHTLDLDIITQTRDSVTYRASEGILDHLVAPNLLHLSLVMRGRGVTPIHHFHNQIQGDDRVPMDSHFIPQFIHQSDCHLISLSLRLPFPDTALFDVLDAVPELITLELKEISPRISEKETTSVTTEQILGWLSPDMTLRRPPALCPRLENFTLSLGRWRRKTRNNVAAFARTWKADIDNGEQNRVGRLKSFAIRFADLQPVRQGIENVFKSNVLGYLEDWKPKSKYVDPSEIFYLD
ncbi:hypothetical protein PQX77_002300 [Marasmius sp. AFHP31]|nr:hypothetical protein PQX77_002300 [Marasmius sp. AFHP31]